MRGRLTDSRQAERSLVRGLSRCRTGGTPHPPLCRESAAATNRSRTERGDSVTVLTHKRDYTQAIPRRASRNIANGIGTESGAGSVYHAFWLAMPYNPSCVVNFTRTGGFGHAQPDRRPLPLQERRTLCGGGRAHERADHGAAPG